MVKTIISTLIISAILLVGSILEANFIHEQFEDFHSVIQTLYQKVEDQTATQEDVYSVQKNWLKKKSVLHAFIPHNEIKEVDLWLSESATLVRDKEWSDAISKLEVLKELAEQIPKSFKLSFANIL